MKKANIQLEELVCPMCPKKIEDALKKEEGIESITVAYNSAKAKVSYDESKIDIDKITSVIEDLGYDILKVK